MNRVAAASLAFAAAFGMLRPAHAADVSMDPTEAPSGTYQMETAHSQMVFSIRHFGLTDYYGRFDKLSGSLTYDSKKPEASAVTVIVDTDSVDTPSDQLNAELVGSAVFDTARFPNATFKSTVIERTGPDTGEITGDLTLHGVTKPVTLDATFTGTLATPMGDSRALGFRATGTIKRSDFGLTGMVWNDFVGDEVSLIIVAMFQHGKT